MGLLDEFHAAQSEATKGPKCSVRQLLDEWSADPDRAGDADDLRAALEDHRLQHVVIRTVLRNRGVMVADSTIGRHRAGKCRCGSE